MASFKEIVLQMTEVGERGEFGFAPLREYAKAFGMSEDKADEILDDVIEELLDDGTLTDECGYYYLTDKLNEALDEEESQMAEFQAYLADIETAWNARF